MDTYRARPVHLIAKGPSLSTPNPQVTPKMANSAPLPPWPLSEIVLLKERIAPHFVFGLFCAVSPLALFPLRESIRRREPLRALLLLASAVSTVYLQLISYDAGYNWAFGYSGAREKAARIAQAGMLGKAITGAVVGYYLGVGEGGMWLRTVGFLSEEFEGTNDC